MFHRHPGFGKKYSLKQNRPVRVFWEMQDQGGDGFMGGTSMMTWEHVVQLVEAQLQTYDTAVQGIAKKKLLERLELGYEGSGRKN